MKKIRMIAWALCTALTFSLTGCGVGMANPLVKMENWSALHDALGFPMAAPNFALDVKYFVLDKDIAQINFITRSGLRYTLRGTKRTEDIAGVYGTPVVENPWGLASGDLTTTLHQKNYDDNICVFTWSWGDVKYTLIAQRIEGQSIPMDDLKGNAVPVAYICATISAGSQFANDPQRYIEETHKASAIVQELTSCEVKLYEEIDKSTLTTDSRLQNATLGGLVLDAQSPDAPDAVTYYSVLQNDPESILVRAEVLQIYPDGNQYLMEYYTLLQKAENGLYYCT